MGLNSGESRSDFTASLVSLAASADLLDLEGEELSGEDFAPFFVAFRFAGFVTFLEVFLFELFPAAMLDAPMGERC
ncbi:MAG: hypothetical protein MI807_23885 [Verrucomicrobiales bacterium]|nr:hypothetical protein [Verrucomicrobiales bacterium]